MPKELEFNTGEVDLASILAALIDKSFFVVLAGNKNVDVGFVYDEGTHDERTELIICYLRQHPEMLRKVKREFGLHGINE